MTSTDGSRLREGSGSSGALLATQQMTKDYPGVRALSGVDFELRSGEVHVLFGENGAGKSTLITILAGANRPTSGRISYRGSDVDISSVDVARGLGISAVFQEFSLVPHMTVEENMFLGSEPVRGGFVDFGFLRSEARRILDDLDFRIDPSVTVDSLSRAERQMVEIAKAFRSELSVLILDEPTASLTDYESERLFNLIDNLKSRGIGIIYITHRMGEIRRIGDRITVLRDGHYISTVDASSTSENELIELMTGRVAGEIFPSLGSFSPGDVVLEARDVRTADGSVNGASLSVRSGEIVGLTGLVGSGKSELMRACFGALPISDGQVFFDGEDVTSRGPSFHIRSGFLYLPPDRWTDGLMMMRSVRENMSLASLDVRPFGRGIFVDRSGESSASESFAERLNLTPRRIDLSVEHFSGGNQQKTMLARSLARDYRLIVFDEPTVGVDVGTRSAIYEFIVDLSRSGVSIVLVSSDLPEVLNLSHRAFVFYRGEIQAEFSGSELTESNVLAHFFEREAA